MNRFAVGVGMVCLSAFGFALLPIFAVYAYKHGASVATLLFLRFLFAALVLLLISGKSVGRIRLSRTELAWTLLLGGVFYTLQSLFYLSSVRYIPTSLASLLLYTYPIFVSLLSILLGRETLNKRVIGAAVIAFIGLGFVLRTSAARINPQGVILAVGAAVVYSFYILIGSNVVKKTHPILTSAYVSVFAGINLCLFGMFTQSLHFNMGPVAWMAIGAIALFSTILAIVTFFVGVNLIGPVRASILSMLEPLLTVGFGLILFQETLTWLQVLGGVIVLASGVYLVLTEKEDFRKSAAMAEINHDENFQG